MIRLISVWVLSSCVPDSPDPVYPSVYGREAAARAGYDQTMRSEWETQQPEDEKTCEPLPYPDDPDEANRILGENNPEWGRWSCLAKVDIEAGDVSYQLLRDLIQLAERAPAYVKGYAWAVNAVAAARTELDGLLLAELAKPVELPHRPESDDTP